MRERAWGSAFDVKRWGGGADEACPKVCRGAGVRDASRCLPTFPRGPRQTALWGRSCYLFILPEQSLAAGPQGPRIERLCHVCTHRGRDPGPASRADSLPGVRAHEDLMLVSRLCSRRVDILDDCSN